jgi:hypothetical protein
MDFKEMVMSLNFSDPSVQVSSDPERSRYRDDVVTYKTAYLLYQKAERKAKLRKLFCMLTGRCYTLRNFSQAVGHCCVNIQASLGIQAVELHKIRGSESCYQDFDADFNPLAVKDRKRWIYIAEQYLRGYGLAEVDLLKIGGEYFVRDGHQRISVMRALGYRFVDANVTVWSPTETY